MRATYPDQVKSYSWDSSVVIEASGDYQHQTDPSPLTVSQLVSHSAPTCSTFLVVKDYAWRRSPTSFLCRVELHLHLSHTDIWNDT